MSNRVFRTEDNALPVLNSDTLLAWLADYDDGVMLSNDTVTLFQYLIDNYIVWGMGKDYVAMAEYLVNKGYCLLSKIEAEQLGVGAPSCTIQHPHSLTEKVDGSSRCIQYKGEDNDTQSAE